MPTQSLAAELSRRLVLLLTRSLIGLRSPGLLGACAIVGLVFITVAAHAQTVNAQTRLLRTPTVSETEIAFAYANNIWTVPRSGGSARRLTSFQGQTSNPHFSPDGKWIAFSGEYAGNLDVYVVPADGGEPRRLTWHPGGDLVQGWTPDGKSILFSSSRATWAPSGAPRFWTVPATGGVEEPMPLPRAYQGKISGDGTRIAYRMNNSWDEERRNYRGGQNRPIWIVDLKNYDLISPPWTDSKDVDPVWLDDAVYFISDRDGVANIWEYQTKTKKLSQLTRFTDFDVKSLDSGTGSVVFEQAGYVHELDPRSGKEHIVNITAAGDFPWMMPNWEDVTNRMTNMTLSPTGKRVLVEARGEIFTIPAEKGDVRNLTNSSGSAERDPAWSPDGKFISYFSDKSGEYRLYIEAQDGLTPPREIVLQNPTHYYTPFWSPDSKKLVFTDTNLRVWVIDVASGQVKVVGRRRGRVPARQQARQGKVHKAKHQRQHRRADRASRLQCRSILTDCSSASCPFQVCANVSTRTCKRERREVSFILKARGVRPEAGRVRAASCRVTGYAIARSPLSQLESQLMKLAPMVASWSIGPPMPQPRVVVHQCRALLLPSLRSS